jgi:hypothetical protein
MLLDADDRLCRDALQQLGSALESDPSASLAYGSCVYIGEDGARLAPPRRSLFSPKPSGDVLGTVLRRNFIWSPGAVLMRRGALHAAGGLREDLILGQDWELWCRMAAVGPFVFAGHDIVLEYRIRKGSVARSTAEDARNMAAAIDAVFDNPYVIGGFRPRQVRRLRRLKWAEAELLAAVEALRSGRKHAALPALGRSLRRNPWSVKANLLGLLLRMPRVPAAFARHLGVTPRRDADAMSGEGERP